MNGFLEDLKGSFGILSNADVMSYLLRGLMFTLVISVIAIVFSLLLGVALALARNYCTRGPARVLQKMASIYIELFRNTPLMLWMFVCFVMCPAPAVSKSFAEMLGMSSTVAVKTLFKAIAALTLFTSAIMAEIIREKVLLLTEEEVPHSVAVVIERIRKNREHLIINAMILVERDSQKGIIIGKHGDMLKRISTLPRKFRAKVRLPL